MGSAPRASRPSRGYMLRRWHCSWHRSWPGLLYRTAVILCSPALACGALHENERFLRSIFVRLWSARAFAKCVSISASIWALDDTIRPFTKFCRCVGLVGQAIGPLGVLAKEWLLSVAPVVPLCARSRGGGRAPFFAVSTSCPGLAGSGWPSEFAPGRAGSYG